MFLSQAQHQPYSTACAISLPAFDVIPFMKLVGIDSSRLRDRIAKSVLLSSLPPNWGNGFLTGELNQNGA